MNDLKNIIKATNIHRSFGKGDLIAHILKGIDITIKQGEFVAIMGKSGAGKSTLMYQLSVLDEPTEGEISIDGTNVIELNEKERTTFRLNTLGYVFQDYALVPDLSAQENVMMPLLMKGMTWQDAKKKAGDSLDSVGLPDKYTNLPAELSGGEQQRVAIARALVTNPSLVIADEPTANLDSNTSKNIIELMRGLNDKEKTTFVFSTHDQRILDNVERLVCIEDGMIQDKGDKK